MLDTLLTPYELAELDLLEMQANRPPLWIPNDGPQSDAYHSKADILGYGGAGGGGKTDLLLGLAANHHHRSIIFRRIFKNLRGIIDRSREILNPYSMGASNDSYNESLHRWKLDNGKQIELESMQYEKDKENFRGFPHDFYGFDEATEITRTQFEFVLGWMRTTRQGQRCRAVLTFNPPQGDDGAWVVDYFRPWLAHLFPNSITHHNPAEAGELRWYTTIDGKETECGSGEPFTRNGVTYHPLSRTFIPAKLSDNPYLENSGYRSILQAMPEPLRSQMLNGDFAIKAGSNPWQVIPTEWVRLAQTRWLEMEKPKTPLSGVGVDVARGGLDALAIVKRYGIWFDEVIKIPGVNVEDGPRAAGYVHQQLEKENHIGYINIDVIGVGTSCYDSLKMMYPTIAYDLNAARKSSYTVKDKTTRKVILKMRNIRAEYYWRMREALDPSGDNPIALPSGNELVADLCAATYKMMAGGIIQIESKDAIKKRIGRSPDIGEAVMFANMPAVTSSTLADVAELGHVDNFVSRWE